MDKDISFPNDPAKNPCVGCGACCQFYRVSFYYGETTDHHGTVPSNLVIPITPFLVAMKGTDRQKPCVAYESDKGCSIYDQRPSACRGFEVWDDNGQPDVRCTKARAAFGLPPVQQCNIFYKKTA